MRCELSVPSAIVVHSQIIDTFPLKMYSSDKHNASRKQDEEVYG